MFEVKSQGYQLRYLVDEDRIIVSVNISPQQELVMPMTRRLTRALLEALTKLVAQPERLPSGVTPQFHDSVLDFQHASSIETARADGHLRDVPQAARPAHIAGLVKEVQITPRAAGALALIFSNAEQRLVIEVEANRVHMVIETFIQMAERAGWDFPPSATWLDPAKRAEGVGQAVN